MIYTKELQTERLVLRKATENDTESLYSNWDSDVEMHKYVGYELHTNIEDTEKLINKWMSEYEYGRLTWVIEIKESSEIIGVISASRNELDNKITEVGFSIGTKYQGNGYATEALKAIIGYLILECGLNIVKGGCYATNVKSARTMLKAGMKEVENNNKDIRYFEIKKEELKEDRIMNYRLPTLEDYEILKDYVIEHYSNHERSISASLGMTNMKYEDWVNKVNRNSEEATDEWGRYYLYLAFDGDRLVGLLNIRYDLSEDLKELYGDIGYGVRPSERRKGYATKMLEYALKVCKEKNMKEAILGCYEKNYGSNRTIQKNGGVLYRTSVTEKKLSDEWTIELRDNFYKIELY